jgi:ABC-type transport system substrate-binding protein
MYLGMNRDIKPFDNEQVRQAIGLAIDKQRIVSNVDPPGSVAATQFLPPGIPGYAQGFTDFTPDIAKAKQLLTAAGFPNGFSVNLSYRNVVRGYLPQPDKVAQDLQDQLSKIGIKVTIDQEESTTFLDNAQAGKLPLYMLGWGADYPDATNFLDYHFGKGASPQFGKGFDDIWANLDKAGSLSDQSQRNTIYADVAKQLQQHVPMVPIAYGGSATAYKAGVTNPQASPLSNEIMALMQVPNQDQFTFEQNAEPGGLYCADETDGESLRVCEQVMESLLGFKPNSTDVVPALATAYKASSDLKEWTFTLRPNVKFSDGSAFTANDVARSFRVQWDAKDPAHKGRTGDFNYFTSLFGGFLNPPPAKS